jgi:hypothetical protein
MLYLTAKFKSMDPFYLLFLPSLSLSSTMINESQSLAYQQGIAILQPYSPSVDQGIPAKIVKFHLPHP